MVFFLTVVFIVCVYCCRPPRFCQRLMVEYGAFQVLCDILNDADHEFQDLALDMFLDLGQKMLKILHGENAIESYHFLKVYHSQNPKNIPFYTSFQDIALTKPDHSPSASCQLFQPPDYCRLVDTDHNPFDLTLVVHNPVGDYLNVQVHRSILAEESDVFRVMLGGQYRESVSTVVHIHSVPLQGFLAMIHFIYGCGWPCRCVQSQIAEMVQIGVTGEETSSSDATFEGTELLINSIIAPCSSNYLASEIECCLQVLVCAGQFFLQNLITLCELSAACYLCSGNIVAMFNFSLRHQFSFLAESCILTLLDMPHSYRRSDTFKELVASPESEAALKVILDIIARC